MPKFQLVIFDVDGVLTDSEPLYRSMLAGLFQELGAELSPDELRAFTGISANTMWQYIKDRSGLTQTVPELIALEKERKYDMLRATELRATPGVLDLIQTIKAEGRHTAIASSGMRKNIDLILDKTGLNGLFDHIVSGDMVTRGKPHPDIFLKAAEPFGIAPQHGIVIEDSTNGILAASAAGMYTVAYRNPGTGHQDLRDANLIIDRFGDPALLQLLK